MRRSWRTEKDRRGFVWLPTTLEMTKERTRQEDRKTWTIYSSYISFLRPSASYMPPPQKCDFSAVMAGISQKGQTDNNWRDEPQQQQQLCLQICHRG
jgi:hypothetical protein